MSTRNRPAATVGAVRVLAPTGSSPYWRLTWTEPDGRPGRTSGGRSQQSALAKATAIDADLQRATGPRGLTPLGVILAEYVASPAGRHHKADGEDWTPSHLRQVRSVLRRTLRGHEARLALEVDRALADRMRAQPAPGAR